MLLALLFCAPALHAQLQVPTDNANLGELLRELTPEQQTQLRRGLADLQLPWGPRSYVPGGVPPTVTFLPLASQKLVATEKLLDTLLRLLPGFSDTSITPDTRPIDDRLLAKALAVSDAIGKLCQDGGCEDNGGPTP